MNKRELKLKRKQLIKEFKIKREETINNKRKGKCPSISATITDFPNEEVIRTVYHMPELVTDVSSSSFRSYPRIDYNNYTDVLRMPSPIDRRLVSSRINGGWTTEIENFTIENNNEEE